MGIHVREREAQERAQMAVEALGNQAQMIHTLTVSVYELMQRVTAAEVMLSRVLKVNNLDPDEIIEDFLAKTTQALDSTTAPSVEDRIDEVINEYLEDGTPVQVVVEERIDE